MGKPPFVNRQTYLLRSNEPDAVRRFATFAKAGELIIMPTDTVYGIGCDAFNEEAVAKLYEAKQRPYNKAIPILLAEVNQLHRVVTHIPDEARDLIRRFWPGSLTIILPKNPDLPANISPDNTVAVRIPDHALTRSIIRMTGGAMAVTSANLSGEDAAVNGDEAMRIFNGIVAAVLDDGPSRQGVASTVVDCSGATVKVLREGLITKRDLVGD